MERKRQQGVAGHHLRGVMRVVLVSVIAFVCLMTSAAELRQVAIVDLPGVPGFDGTAFANGMLLIGHGGAGTVDVFDPQRRRVVAQIKDVGDVQGIVADEKAGSIYVADSTGKRIVVLSARDWKTTDTVPLQAEPYALTLAGNKLFVGNWRNQSVSSIDIAHGFRVRTLEVGGTPRSLVYDPELRVVYSTLEDRAEVVAIDGNLNVVRRMKLVASQPTGLALDAAGRRLYVAVRHAVSAVQVDTGVEVGRLAAPAGANSLWLDPGSGTLYVGAADGTITMMRATGSGFAPLGEVHTEVRGSSLAFDAVRGLLFVPGGLEGKSKLLIMKRVEPAQAASNSH